MLYDIVLRALLSWRVNDCFFCYTERGNTECREGCQIFLNR